MRFHANLGKILKITGIYYGPSPFLLQPISSVPTFGKSTYPLFCPRLSMLGREVAQGRMGDHLQGNARSRTLPLTFFFFFFKEKRYLDPSYLINYSNSPFYSVHINTTLICEPDSHPCLLNGGNLDLKNICCAPDLGRLGIIILESQPVEK